MATCKACGEWFGTCHPKELCPTCERALKRLNGYAEPVRHGRLGIPYIDEYYVEFANYQKCGTDNILPCNFCRNCGAKMDLEGHK